MPSLSDRLMPHLRRVALTRDAAPLTDGQLLGSFVADRDPASFEALVRRHGPMVFGVCRRVVGHTHTAEDAFQAVFVVLARRAAAVKPREQLANWLFGVAYRTALKARGGLARQRSREKQVPAMPDVPATPAELWSDIQPVLDAELAALPDHLRLPVVLCDLEGRSQRDAAKQLKVPPATLANRLTAARRRLAARLTAKGITLSGGLFATVLAANVGSAAVPAAACAAAAKVGLTAVGAAAGAVPESVLHLSEGVLRMMMLTKLKAVSAVALAGLMLLGGLGLGTLPHAFAQGQPAPAPKAKPAIGPTLTDAEFLKRNCETLRGTPATPAELSYFVADADANKRKKVVTWLTEAEDVLRMRLNGINLNTVPDVDDIRRRLSYDLLGTPNGARVSRFVQSQANAENADVHLIWAADAAYDLQVPGEPSQLAAFVDGLTFVPGDSDADFLNKATTEARGTAPTKLEREYFLADKDPKKREKLLDLLLSDPAVTKKVGPEWKKNLLAPPLKLVFSIGATGADWSKLIGELQTAKKSDEQILEALTLAITGRLPTEVEKKLVGAMVAKQQDKKAAWSELATTLSGTAEAKKHAEKLKPADHLKFIELHGTIDDAKPLGKFEIKLDPKSPEPKK